MNRIQKLSYLFGSTRKRLLGHGSACPDCGNTKSTTVDRKFLVTSLVRCCNCRLLFRTPTSTAEEFSSFYQAEYKQGFTTDLPDKLTLDKLILRKFAGTEKDYSKYLQVIASVGGKPGQKLFDFGCSWGYGSWQFREAGFDTASFEISTRRAAYAINQLGMTVYSDIEAVPVVEQFDIFFSAHVLEHLPSISGAIEFAFKILKPGGLFVAFVPNGSEEYRKVNPSGWHKCWGYVHPNMLDEQYFRHVFDGNPRWIGSTPFNLAKIEAWANDGKHSRVIDDLLGDELVVIAKKLNGQA
ncbi:MAG: class I SAM-dependent methyltransferase [Betaproteobacteria bacterium]|nr:class I SAM-dependent methyltransferase [Betaproteobacteria bacterium]